MGSGNKPVLSPQKRKEVRVKINRMNERSKLFLTAGYVDIRNLQRIL